MTEPINKEPLKANEDLFNQESKKALLLLDKKESPQAQWLYSLQLAIWEAERSQNRDLEAFYRLLGLDQEALWYKLTHEPDSGETCSPIWNPTKVKTPWKLAEAMSMAYSDLLMRFHPGMNPFHR
ncbi:MAG TPA: hypothetical protein PLB81_01580 [Deltaproteobacteria bacterium]|nr:hypothetical protein [Deltaproteobacteria bacterium]